MAAVKIYWFKAQAPRRVLAVAKHLGIVADLVEVDLAAGDLRSAEYAALNPNQTAPTLIDGGHVIWESSAIMAYLCIKAGSDMWPAHNATEQVEVLRWLSWNDCQWAPAIGPFYFERIVKATFALGPPDEDAIQNCLGKFLRYAKVLNSHLDGRTHVACERLTIADFQLASMASYWREAQMPMRAFPHILAWVERLQQLPAWRDPWPEQAV